MTLLKVPENPTPAEKQAFSERLHALIESTLERQDAEEEAKVRAEAERFKTITKHALEKWQAQLQECLLAGDSKKEEARQARAEIERIRTSFSTNLDNLKKWREGRGITPKDIVDNFYRELNQ